MFGKPSGGVETARVGLAAAAESGQVQIARDIIRRSPESRDDLKSILPMAAEAGHMVSGLRGV